MATTQESEITVYKVVRCQDGGLWSVMMDHPRWRTKYTPDLEVYPSRPKSLLFAFGTEESAATFAQQVGPSRTGNTEVWLATAGSMQEYQGRIPLIVSLSCGRYIEEAWVMFWKAFGVGKSYPFPTPAGFHFIDILDPDLIATQPRGTVFCGSITLLEKVA